MLSPTYPLMPQSNSHKKSTYTTVHPKLSVDDSAKHSRDSLIKRPTYRNNYCVKNEKKQWLIRKCFCSMKFSKIIFPLILGMSKNNSCLSESEVKNWNAFFVMLWTFVTAQEGILFITNLIDISISVFTFHFFRVELHSFFINTMRLKYFN